MILEPRGVRDEHRPAGTSHQTRKPYCGPIAPRWTPAQPVGGLVVAVLRLPRLCRPEQSFQGSAQTKENEQHCERLRCGCADRHKSEDTAVHLPKIAAAWEPIARSDTASNLAIVGET